MMSFKVLNYIPAFSVGGIESLTMSIGECIFIKNKDVKYDFLIETCIPTEYKMRIESFGGTIYKIEKPNFNIFKHIYQVYNILKNEKYDIVHIHSFSTRPFVSILAKFLNVKVIAVHAHTTNYDNNIYLKKMISNITVCLGNNYYACSKEASNFVFGNKKNVEIINNAIDVKKFRGKFTNKDELYSSNKKFIIGNIGRLCTQKNQKFIIDIAIELKKINNNFIIKIIGQGPLKDFLIHEIEKNNLLDNIFLIDNVLDVRDELNSFDLFLFPSLYEGLGIVLIEAQVAGIPCIASDSIPDSSQLGKCKYINLNETAEFWAKEIYYELNNKCLSKNKLDEEKVKRYDINNVVDTLLSSYKRGIIEYDV